MPGSFKVAVFVLTTERQTTTTDKTDCMTPCAWARGNDEGMHIMCYENGKSQDIYIWEEGTVRNFKWERCVFKWGMRHCTVGNLGHPGAHHLSSNVIYTILLSHPIQYLLLTFCGSVHMHLSILSFVVDCIHSSNVHTPCDFPTSARAHTLMYIILKQRNQRVWLFMKRRCRWKLKMRRLR